ncbi:LrgB family protein [Halovulum sp. GXIMD14794]
MTELGTFWSYLTEGPLLWLLLTLLAYALGQALNRATNGSSLANPVLIAVAALGSALYFTSTPYDVYFEGAQFVHFLLGPATVALALPLYDNISRLRASLLPIVASVAVGSTVACLSALLIAWALGVGDTELASLAPKSATAPVAIGIAERIGGLPTLTALLVILTGITGAVVATPLLNAIRVRDWRARGLSVGTASHGIGTARALEVNPIAGAFAGLGMALNAVVTALVAPLILRTFLEIVP